MTWDGEREGDMERGEEGCYYQSSRYRTVHGIILIIL